MTERLALRFGGYQTEASVHTRALRALAADLEARLGGAAAIDIVANVTEQGRKAADLFTMVAGNELDLFYFSSSYVDAAQAPALAALDLPFLNTERERIFAKLDGRLGERIASELAAASPYRLLGFWDNGVRHLSNCLHPIRTPADCAGLRLRTTANALHQEIFSAVGFVPMSIDPKDLPRAVADHVVDAQENPLSNLVQFGLYRTHRHLSLTGHFFGFTVVLVNRRRFDSWPKQVREALETANREATVRQRQFALDEDARCLQLLQADGVAIVLPDAIDRDAFKAAVAGILAREATRLGPDVVAALQEGD
jgi:TRAP-type C4-dicarboxylate transport system substrate-binding protein